MSLKHKKTHVFGVMFCLLAVMLLVALVSDWGGPVGAAETPTLAVIRGQVVDEDGKPVAGALVHPGYIYMLGEQSVIAKTDESGTFQFELESKYLNPWLSFHAVTEDQTLLASAQIKFEEGVATIPEVTITLKPGRVITGTVVDEDGKPVEGATVAGVDQTTYPNLTTTDTEGNFRFAYPKESRSLQQVYAFKEGIGFNYLCTEEIDHYRGITPPEKISDGPFTLKLSPFKPVEIRVVNEDREPLPGATVGPWLIGKKGEKDSFNTSRAPNFFTNNTNAEGVATLQCLPEWAIDRTRYTAYGPSEGILQDDGTRVYYGDDNKSMDEFENRQFTPSNIRQQMQNFAKNENYQFIPTFVLPKQARVKGTVKLPDGTPVPWARITRASHATCGHGIRHTDANGEFELRENVHQKLDLAVDESKFGATPGVFAFDVGDGTSEKRLNFVLEKGIRLHGTVYGLGGKPADKEYWICINENDPNPEPCDPDSDECPTGGCPVGVVIRRTGNYGESVLDGKYEYLLPTVKRSYSIRASLYGADGYTSHEFTLNGDEEEHELNLHLKVAEKE